MSSNNMNGTEVDTGSLTCSKRQHLDLSTSTNDRNKSSAKEANNSVFVNHDIMGRKGRGSKPPSSTSHSYNLRSNPVHTTFPTWMESHFKALAATAWQESRRKWIGDPSQRSEKMTKEPIISWSTTYEELLSTNEPFSEPIPLPEMVDFLVDIWHAEGLFD